jgi:hypothetical protein
MSRPIRIGLIAEGEAELGSSVPERFGSGIKYDS